MSARNPGTVLVCSSWTCSQTLQDCNWVRVTPITLDQLTGAQCCF